MANDNRPSRRKFLKASSVLGVAAVAGRAAQSGASVLPPLPSNPVTEKAMPTRNLGHTGYRVGIFSLGGQVYRGQSQPKTPAVSRP